MLCLPSHARLFPSGTIRLKPSVLEWLLVTEQSKVEKTDTTPIFPLQSSVKRRASSICLRVDPNTIVDKCPLSEGAPGQLGKQTHGAMRTGAQALTHTAGEREGRNLLKVFIALSVDSSAQTVADVQGQNLQEQTELPG